MAQLHEDLLAIRTQSGLSANDIYEKTRIPISTITEIEKGLIFENPAHQPTYVRSFVRAYAKAIGIKDDDVIRALDAKQDDRYKGSLAVKYLGLSPAEAGFDETADAAEINKINEDGLGASMLRPGPTSTVNSDEYSRPDPSRAYNKVTPPPPDITNVDWAGLDLRIGSFSGIQALTILAVLVIVLVAAGIWYFTSSDEAVPDATEITVSTPPAVTPLEPSSATPSTPEAPTPATAEILPLPVPTTVTPAQIPSASTGVSLPDTLYVVVHAALEKLEPVRILSDVNNTTSPYWIENGQAMRFEFLSQIDIRGQLSRMAVFVNGHYVEDFLDFDVGNRTIRLTREIFSAHPEWFNTEPAPLPPSVSPPTAIRDRPVFSNAP